MMQTLVLSDREAARDAAGLWWLFLLAGLVWLVASIVILRFDYGSAEAVAVLFGIVAVFAGAGELMRLGASTVTWRVVHGVLGAVFVVIGIVAFVHPGDTLRSAAAVVSFFLVLAGARDVVLAMTSSGETKTWWLTLALGVAEVLLGFWAAGYWAGSTTLVVALVGAVGVTRGLAEIAFAVELHELHRFALRASTKNRPFERAIGP